MKITQKAAQCRRNSSARVCKQLFSGRVHKFDRMRTPCCFHTSVGTTRICACSGNHLEGSVTLVELIRRVHELLEDGVLDAPCLPDGKLLRCVVEGEDGQRHPGMKPDVLQQSRVVRVKQLHPLQELSRTQKSGQSSTTAETGNAAENHADATSG